MRRSRPAARFQLSMIDSLNEETTEYLNRLASTREGRKALNNVLGSPRSFLRKFRWIESMAEFDPTFEGEPVPWFNYGVVRFLRSRVKRHMVVFEYGSGFSTQWWEKHAASVDAVEHDAKWAEKVAERLSSRATIRHIELDYDGKYCRAILAMEKRYDVVVVDGRDRVNCMRIGLQRLTDDGVIVFDNSQRRHYRDKIEEVKAQGWKEIQFSGLAPMTYVESFTSVLYRAQNCFGI